jgi:hypothetical protein
MSARDFFISPVPRIAGRLAPIDRSLYHVNDLPGPVGSAIVFRVDEVSQENGSSVLVGIRVVSPVVSVTQGFEGVVPICRNAREGRRRIGTGGCGK